jgi:hypothetical protein
MRRWFVPLLLVTACSDEAPRYGTNNGGFMVLPDGAVVGPGDGNGDGFNPGDGNNPGDGQDGDGDWSDDPNEPLLIDDCKAGAAGLSDQQIAALKAGGNAGGARLLYPYDGTVFPRGLGSPTLMWEGANGQAVYVHIKAQTFEYHGCLPAADNRVELPKQVWEAAGAKTHGTQDPFAVELSVLEGGGVRGPLKQSWTIAQATIKGSIYYNSYISSTYPAGRIYRIPAGGTFEPFITDQLCSGCHSVSANGERMTTQLLTSGGPTYDLASGSPVPLAGQATSPYAALSPDGSVYVRPSLAREVARSVLTSAAVVALSGTDAALFSTDTGAQVTTNGLPKGALMPSFSPDGSLLIFTDNDAKDAHVLATVQFDAAGKSFGGYKAVFEDTNANTRPGWPFVLPDNRGAVFVRADASFGDWSAQGAGAVAGGITSILAPYSELFMVDLDSGNATILARAMGYNSAADAQAKKTYLPFGAEDTEHVYFPTVSPVAAGGYFWVFFDTIRHYGNHGRQRALWGTAIAISPDGDYSVDRSAPAFYLPGQEFGTGNHRAFTALDPCKADGDSCTSGVDCCGGFCTFPEGGDVSVNPVGMCSSTVRECSRTDERCSLAGDCCEPGAGEPQNSCINGFCAPVVVF